MAEPTTMTNLQLQDDILKNLLLGLQKQSQFYVQKINETGELTEERKNFEKELSDINKVLTELSNKALSYTVQELDNLRTQFNDKLLQLNSVISDLEINTLKIEFNSLTPEQKQFLKGEKGEKGDRGYNPYEFAKMFGFIGTESDYLLSLKGADGQNGTNGIDGKDFTFDMFTPAQLKLIADLVTVDLTSILTRISDLETQIVALGGSVTPPVVEPDYFYPKPYIQQITTNYETTPYTMTIDAGYYESEMLDLVEMSYVYHHIKTNIDINNSSKEIATNIEVIVSDGLSENPLTGNCIVYNYSFINNWGMDLSGGAYELGEYSSFPPEMTMFFANVDKIDNCLVVSLHTDTSGIIKNTFYQYFGTDKLFYKFKVVVSSVEPIDFAENQISQYSELWGMIE